MLLPLDGWSPDACLPIDATSTIVADSHTGFRDVQGECGWSYGQRDPNVGLLQLFATTDATHVWPSSLAFPQLTVDGQHPSATTRAVRRWTTSVGGTLRIQGQASLVDASSNAIAGNGVDLFVAVGSTQVYSRTITGSLVAVLDLEVSVVKGMPIDVEVDARAGNASYDATRIWLRIERPP